MNIEMLKQCPGIESVHSFSPEQVVRYTAENIPVVIKGATAHWPATHKWNFDFFRDHYGEQPVYANQRFTYRGDMKKVAVKLKDYIDYVETTDEYPPFYSSFSFHLGTDIEKDYEVPDYFNCWYRELPSEERAHPLSWIFIGPTYSVSELHKDVYLTSAWNALMVGQKLWIFYPGEQDEFIYGGDVNPWDPDYERFPKYRQARPHVHIQQPGDLMFTPSNCWHAVINLEPTIAVTENFINESNYQIVLDFFEQEQAVQAQQKLARIVSEKLGQVA